MAPAAAPTATAAAAATTTASSSKAENCRSSHSSYTSPASSSSFHTRTALLLLAHRLLPFVNTHTHRRGKRRREGRRENTERASVEDGEESRLSLPAFERSLLPSATLALTLSFSRLAPCACPEQCSGGQCFAVAGARVRSRSDSSSSPCEHSWVQRQEQEEKKKRSNCGTEVKSQFWISDQDREGTDRTEQREERREEERGSGDLCALLSAFAGLFVPSFPQLVSATDATAAAIVCCCRRRRERRKERPQQQQASLQ